MLRSSMDLLRISSRQNRRIKVIKKAKDTRETDFLFLEGRKLVEEGLAVGAEPEIAVVSDAFAKANSGDDLLERLMDAQQGLLQVPNWLMAELSVVQTPPGLIALVPRSRHDLQGLPEVCSFVMIAHGIQDPGNMGTLLRSAEAAGAEAAAVTREGADPLGPKALRGSMGAALRVPLWYGATLPDIITECHVKGLQVFAASPRGTHDFWQQDWAQPCAILLGSEGQGLSPEELAQADEEILIPMAGKCESLNVGAAGAILLYEVARQRRG